MESSLTIPKAGIEASLLVNLGWDVVANLSDRQKAVLKEIIDSGVSQFYNAALEGSNEAYEWSFLRPTRTLTLTSGSKTMLLPDDYDGIIDRITVLSSTQVFWPIEVVSEGTIRERYATLPTYTGRPQLAAEQVADGPGPARGPRFQLFVFPQADADYSLQFAYRVSGSALTDASPYIYGGAAHRETIIESCLAIAEQRLDDSMGVHTQKYQERLRASIMADQRHKPQLLGYNGDRSDDIDRYRGPYHQHGVGLVKVGSVQY